MSEYEVQVVDLDGNGDVYFVYETATDQYIDWSLVKDIMIERAKFLNSGGGFAGWTPEFMLVETPTTTDINEDFELLVGEL